MATVQAIGTNGTGTPLDTVATEIRLEAMVAQYGAAYIIEKLINVMYTRTNDLLKASELNAANTAKVRAYTRVQRELLAVWRTAAGQENL